MDNKCDNESDHNMLNGITIHYHSIDIFDDNGAAAGKQFLKTWWNWKGIVPQKGDIVVLHWGDNSEEAETWRVASRVISGTKEGEVNIYLTKIH